MEKGQRGKKFYYIAGIIGILGLLLIIGVWRNYFESEVRKDKVYTALITNRFNQTNREQYKPTAAKSAANEVLQPKRCGIDVNAIYSLVLLGVGWWLKLDCKRQSNVGRGYTKLGSQSWLPFKLRRSHYILAAVVLGAMLGYIGYFFYQHYSLDSTCAKDMAILFFGMPLPYRLIIAFGIKKFGDDYPEITFSGISIIFYCLGRWWLRRGLSNNKVAFLAQGWSFDMQWFFSSYTCAYCFFGARFYSQSWKYPWIYILLLWCVPVACLYVQAHWSPQLCFSSGHAKIDYFIAWPFWTSNLWLALGLTELYDRKALSGTYLSGLVLVWLLISYKWWSPAEKATMHSQQT